MAGLLLPALARSVIAQAPAAAGSAAPGAGSGAAPAAPGGVSGPAPSVSSGLPGTSTAGRILTLPDVVARVLGNNSGLEVARQRLQRAQESINQVNAQARPQFRLNANNTYSSYPAFPAALPVPTIANPTLPDNGTLPTVTDLANNFSTSFIGGTGLALGSGGGSVVPGVASGIGGGGTGGAGSTTAGVGNSPNGAAGTSGPGVGGTGGTTGGTATTGTSPGVGTGTGPGAGNGGAGNGGNAPANGEAAGGTAPTTGAGTNGTAPANSDGGGAGGNSPANGAGATPGASPAAPTGTSPASPNTSPGSGPAATGLTMLAYPAIVAGYVADLRTLLLPPASYLTPPAVAAPTPKAKPDAAPTPDALPRATDPPTGTGTTGGAPAARGQRDTYAAGGNVTQYIDLFGLVGTARTAEKDVRDFYALDIARLQNETAYAAKNLFFNVLYAQALVATQQEQVAYATENVRITESRLRNGVVSRFDVLTAQAALATAQQQLTAAQDQAQLAQAELSYLLGTDPDQPQTLLPPALPPLTQTVNLRQSTQIAERQRPELGQATRNIDNAQRQVRLASSGLLPTLGLVGSGEYTSNASTVTPRSYGTLSAQVAVPLDDGGLTRSRVRSAQVQVQTQAITQEQLQLSVALEVRQAAINIRNAQAEAASAQVGVDRSQEALRLARERYGAGLGTFLDVLNALAQLATARTNLANAQYFYQSSLAQLVRAMGGR